MVCDTTTSFVLRAFPYVGIEEREVKLGEHKTLSLMEPYRNTGLNVITDNFFTSLSLAKRLLQSNITMLAPMRAHRREIPPEANWEKVQLCIHLHFYLGHQKKILCFLATKQRKLSSIFTFFQSQNNNCRLWRTKKSYKPS